MDPLSEVVNLLHPGAAFSKLVTGAGRFQVRQPLKGHAFFCAVLEGSSQLTFDGQPTLDLREGDFVLMPANPGFTLSTQGATEAHLHTAKITPSPAGVVRYGEQDGPPDLRHIGGVFTFASPDAALLLSLLPGLIHVRNERRLLTLAQLVNEELRVQRPARDAVIARLLEVMLIEALRSSQANADTPGLSRGLADPRLAAALREIHDKPARPWTVGELAKISALSRSSFFERFSRAMGVPPMEYLLGWRMTLAKDLLRRDGKTLSEIAERIGYSSASTFSTAFTRYVGLPPSQYMRRLGQE